MAIKNRHGAFLPPTQDPRRALLKDGTLVLPPFSLRDLPPDCALGTFMGVLALRYVAPRGGLIAAFVHDLGDEDVRSILDHQRAEAEAQLGAGYARRAMWWERT